MSKKIKVSIITALSVILALALTYFILACVFVCKENYSQSEGLSSFQKITQSASDVFAGPPSVIWRKVVYNITGTVSAGNVKNGEEDFLFPVKSDSFDYKADFKGEYQYTDEQYGKIAENITVIKEAYEEIGADYYLYVIPNSQTVYDGIAPFGDKISENTRTGGLIAYLKGNADINIDILTESLKSDGGAYDRFNNTENSINRIGAYYVYDAIKAQMPNDLNKSSAEIDINDFEITLTETDGKELASRIGLEKTVKNKTYSIDVSSLEKRYTVQEKDGNVILTDLKASAGVSGTSSVMVQIPSEHERSVLKTYFSATYTDVAVLPDIFYNEAKGSPAVVLQILREDQIDMLLDDTVMSSYGVSSDNGGVTKAPEVHATMLVERGTALLIGSAEDGAVIEATSGNNSSSVVCRDGLFILTVETSTRSVTLTAKADGKDVSSPVKTGITGGSSPTDSVIVGTGSRMYFTDTIKDFTKQNAFSEKQLLYVQRQINIELNNIRNLTGKNTEMIILCAPNPATVYGDEELPEYIRSRVIEENISRRESFTAKISESEGVTAIDIADIMRENKDIGKLYYQTDTHWTELGAYFGYNAIMNEISKKHPLAAPYTLDDLKIRYNDDIGGDLAGFLDISERITEKVPHLVLNSESKINEEYDKPDTIARPEGVDPFTLTVDNDELPTAYLVRDSYAMQLIPLIGEHFSELYAEEMWNYEIDYDVIRDLKPDYIVYVIAERNIGPVFMK